MGYFSQKNTITFHTYQVEYCDWCIHMDEDTECPVMILHDEWNFEQNKDTSIDLLKRFMLEEFIPRLDESPWNGPCTMYHAREGAVSSDQMKLPLGDDDGSPTQ